MMARQASVDAFARHKNPGNKKLSGTRVVMKIFGYLFWSHASSQLQVWASPSNGIELPVKKQEPTGLEKAKKAAI